MMDTAANRPPAIRPLTIIAVIASVLLAATGCGLFAKDIAMTGQVLDAVTGKPLPVVQVFEGDAAQQAIAVSGENGFFSIDKIREGSELSLRAEGYYPGKAKASEITTTVQLLPLEMELWVDDAQTQTPLASAEVSAGELFVLKSQPGAFRVLAPRTGVSITVSAPDYGTQMVPFVGQSSMRLSLRKNVVAGTVKDAATTQGITGATVSASSSVTRTTTGGAYKLSGLTQDAGQIFASAPGYAIQSQPWEQRPSLDFALQPFTLRAPYVSFFAAGDSQMMGNVASLLGATELNGLVIDIKGDRGFIAYKSAVSVAKAIGANDNPMLDNPRAFVSNLKAKGAYLIARIVVFKDDLLARNGAKAGLDVAIKDASTGRAWIDGEGLGWVDPFRREVWEYNVALAKEAIGYGFDEVQFDYIRFPTDPSSGTSVEKTVYSRENTQANRLAAVSGFLAQAQSAIKQSGGMTSVDVFGFTCWRDDDMGIGQLLEVMGRNADYVCPMVYPSTFDTGLLEYTDAVQHPYEVVFYSTQRAVERVKGLPTRIRPWLQYFDDYPWASGAKYNEAEIRAQIKAANDAGATGWQVWDPYVRYTRGGLTSR